MTLAISTKITTDIVIVGAGIAGCIAAIALAPHYKVVLIDQHAEPPMRVGECLPAAARRILKQLNLLSAFEQQDHIQSQGMASYWGSKKKQISDNILNPDGFGWHINRPNFEKQLRQVAQERGVYCLWPAKLVASKEVSQQWYLTTDTAKVIIANFVIDAGGRKAPFVRQRNIKRTVQDKLVSYWLTVKDDNKYQMGVISANELGWWYSAPIPNNKRIIAFQTDSDLLDFKARKDVTYILKQAATNTEIASWLTNKLSSSIQYHGITSANSSKLCHVAGDNWAALGDAAVSFDPLSSQGMYNAMACAMQLVKLLLTNANIEQQYNYQIENIWQHYLAHKSLYYRQEKRWQENKFWQRRI